MGIMVYSLLWAIQDLYHQPFHSLGSLVFGIRGFGVGPVGFESFG